MDKNGKYWGFMEQNEAIKDTIQHRCWLGDNFINILTCTMSRTAHGQTLNFNTFN